MLGWLLERAAKTKGSEDDRKALASGITVTALKIAKPEQMPQVKAAVDKYGTQLEKDIYALVDKQLKACGDRVACYMAALQKGESQDRATQFAGIKAGYMIGILGNEQNRDEIVAGIDSVTNASVRYVAAQVIDHLSPKGSKDAAKKLNAVIVKNAKSPDREKSSGDSPLKQVMYRLDARAGERRVMSSLRLEVVSGSQAGRIFEADLDVVRVGRSAESDLVLPDAHVSSEHARIVSSVDGFVLEDLDSTNGTWLTRGSQQFSLGEGSRTIALSPGDRLELGGQGSEGTELRLDFALDPDRLEVALVRPLHELGISALGDTRIG